MKKTQTKEELVQIIAKLEQQKERLLSEDERIRKEFANVFEWYTQDFYASRRETKKPSWEEIFVKVGKLLASKNFSDFQERVSELEFRVDSLPNLEETK